VGQAICVLRDVIQVLTRLFHTKQERQFVGTPRIGVAAGQHILSDSGCDDDHRAFVDDLREFPHETPFLVLVAKEHERGFGSPDFVLVQDCAVVPESSKLELLNSGNKPMDVVVFANDTEGKREDWILKVDRFERVITALVNEDDVIGEEQDCLG
jgi:hypothetical protein